MTRHAAPPACLMVVFGAGGDLLHRLLVPALYNLAVSGDLPERFGLVGVARSKISTEEFRARIRKAVTESRSDREQVDEEALARLASRFHYWSGDSSVDETYPALKAFLEKTARTEGTGDSILFYLATPPALFAQIPALLARHGMLQEDLPRSFRRVVFEKPFGTDLASARALNETLSRTMQESQILRIDHYLGKTTVQNVLALRFGNGIFEPLWNRRYIDSIQISVSETLGVEERAGYYEGSGALCDMVPNHLFQLFSLIGMEPPNSFSADDIRDEKVKFLGAVTPFSALGPESIARNAVRGQYLAGKIAPGPDFLPAYRDEHGVAKESNTETFVALKLAVENWRWAGVPFYLRTGKRMPAKSTEISVCFKCAPLQLFERSQARCTPNWLRLGIQPQETISLDISAQAPGAEVELKEISLGFNYAQAFGHVPQNGYETLLRDAMKGDLTLFLRRDQSEAAWRIVDPLLAAWKNPAAASSLVTYPAGSWGPEAASQLLARDGRRWRNPPLPPAPQPKKQEKAA